MSVIVSEVLYQVVIIVVTLRVVCRNFMSNIIKKKYTVCVLFDRCTHVVSSSWPWATQYINSQYHDDPPIRRETQSLLLFQWFITHLLSHILAALQVMVTVWKDLRLNNGYNAMLGGGGVSQKGGSWQKTTALPLLVLWLPGYTNYYRVS